MTAAWEQLLGARVYDLAQPLEAATPWLAPGAGHSRLPVNRVLLVESGIHIVEVMALEELARDGVREFLFVLAPLRLVGATGSPVRPLAVVG